MSSKIYIPTLLIMLSSMVRCQQPITCEAGRFKAGQTASVTCNFPRSVTDIRHHISVVHYPLDAPDDSLGKDIVSCFRADGHELTCDTEKGVQINSDVTDRLTFHIPEVTTDFTGQYACQLVPPDDTIMVFCSLIVEGTFKQNKTEADTIAQPDGINLLGFTIAATTVVILGLAILTINRIKRSCSRGNSTQVDAVKPEYKDGDVYSNARFKNNFKYRHYYTVPGHTGPQFCQDARFKPLKFYNSGAAESKLDQTEIRTGKGISTARSISSISRWGDDDSSDSSIYASVYSDDINSGHDSFYSSRSDDLQPAI